MPQLFPAWMTSPIFMTIIGLVILAAFVRAVRRRGWRQAAVLFVVLGLVGYTGFTGYVKYLFSGFQFPFPPAQVYVQVPENYPFDDRIEAIGTTEANESTAITSNVTRTVKALYVTEGQFVTKGTVIAELDDAAEQATLREAEQAYNRSVELLKSNAISAARVDSDRARLDVARASVNDRKIVAPFDGILGLRSISVGDIVTAGMTITTLDDVDPMKLEFSVPELFLAAMKPGLAIEAHSDAYPGIAFQGTVTAVDPRVDPVTRALKVKAQIENSDGKLRAGMLMKVEIVQNARTALAVSEEALVSKGQQKLVMVTGAPGKEGLSDVAARPVTIGTRGAGFVEITSGLTVQDQVVVDGVIKAHPGGKVKVMGTRTIKETTDRALGFAVQGKQDELKSVNAKKE